MGFIPKGARWYIADVVLEHRIEGDPRNVVHVNTLLVEASSPEEAYDKAIELGQAGEIEYLNTDGKQVTIKFRGLRNLNVIHDDLEHGAEPIYEEQVGVPEDVIRKRLTEKSDLGVFAAISDKEDVPNYMPGDIAREILARLAARDGPADGEGP